MSFNFLLSSEQTFFNSLVNLSFNLWTTAQKCGAENLKYLSCGCHSTRRLISPHMPAWHFSLHPSQLLQQPKVAYQTEFEPKITKSYHFAIHLCVFMYLFSQNVRPWIILFHIRVSRTFWSLNLASRRVAGPHLVPLIPIFGIVCKFNLNTLSRHLEQ